jgi:hypothetical protein
MRLLRRKAGLIGGLLFLSASVLFISADRTTASEGCGHGNHSHSLSTGNEYWYFSSHYNSGSTHYHKYLHVQYDTRGVVTHYHEFHTVPCPL